MVWIQSMWQHNSIIPVGLFRESGIYTMHRGEVAEATGNIRVSRSPPPLDNNTHLDSNPHKT